MRIADRVTEFVRAYCQWHIERQAFFVYYRGGRFEAPTHEELVRAILRELIKPRAGQIYRDNDPRTQVNGLQRWIELQEPIGEHFAFARTSWDLGATWSKRVSRILVKRLGKTGRTGYALLKDADD